MNRNIRAAAAAMAGIGMAAVLVASPAAAAPGDGTWGLWEVSPLTSYDQTGSVTFGDPAQGAIDFTLSFDSAGSTGSASTETSNEKGDWIPVGSPAADVFGATGPSDVENMMVVESGDATTASTTFTFKEPVGANNLGFVVMDIDGNPGDINESDRVTLEATTADGTNLTSAELNAGVFEECNVAVDNMPDNCGGTAYTGVPTLTYPTDTSAFFNGETGDDDGASGWINPTVSVKSVTLTWQSYDSGSSIRVFAAVKPTVPALPNTGVDVSTGLLSALAFGVLGAAAVMITRRRQA